jgi:hypothetical protein
MSHTSLLCLSGTCRLHTALLQKERDITCALGDTYYLDVSSLDAVDDYVSANRPEQDRQGSQILARMPHAGRSGKRLERIEEPRDPTISGVQAVLCDVLPDSIQIKLSVSSNQVVFTHCASVVPRTSESDGRARPRGPRARHDQVPAISGRAPHGTRPVAHCEPDRAPPAIAAPRVQLHWLMCSARTQLLRQQTGQAQE